MRKTYANGTGKISRGGSRKGRPNKVPARLREIVSKYVGAYFCSAKFERDVDGLDPKDRVAAYGKLAEYVLPKLQSTTMDVVTESKVTIEDRLKELADKE